MEDFQVLADWFNRVCSKLKPRWKQECFTLNSRKVCVIKSGCQKEREVCIECKFAISQIN